MDKNNIKTLLSKTFISEANVPGLDVTNKAKAESDKVNKKAIKDMEKELSDYDKESKKQPKDVQNPVKFNYTDDSEAEYHQEMEIMNGQEMIQYDRTPSEEYKKRAEEAIEGSSRMGNNPEWANVVAPGQGGDPTFGKKLVKAIKASEKKRSESTPTTKMFGDDWEVVKDKSHKAYAFENKENNKEIIKESNKMKRLTFKKPFNGVDNALNLIPESYKVDNKTFEMFDGNESYKVRWEGSLNEGKGVVLTASNKEMVNEDMKKIFHLMGYKSEETLGNLKGSERLNENKKFSDIWSKTKTILTESEDMMGEELHGNQGEIDANHNGEIDEKDFELLRKEGNMYEMENQTVPKDVEKLETMMDKNTSITAQLGKINTKDEFINTVTMLVGDILKNNPQLAASEMTLIPAIKKVFEKPQMPVGEGSHMYEEKDRFSEVFDLGEEEMGEY